jgi:RNA polymerase sigma factor (sigma-70 family)
MASGASREVVRQVGRLFAGGTLTGLTDGQLLERFRTRRDEAAFEAIIARHGPMVMGVCRGVLRDSTEVEDAFQAAFLVLVKKAGSIRGRDGVGGWLYRVSYRLALRARDEAARRDRLKPAEATSPEDPETAAIRAELRSLVHAELARLPEKYRAPVVLCDLEGLTHDEAAQRLRWPIGTVKGRLSRARERLRERLQRRGLAEPSAVLAATIRPGAIETAISEGLMRATVLAAVAMGGGTPGAVPASVLVLVTGALRAMLWMKLGQMAAGIAAVGLVAGVVAVPGQPEPTNGAGGAAVRSLDGSDRARPSNKEDRVSGRGRRKDTARRQGDPPSIDPGTVRAEIEELQLLVHRLQQEIADKKQQLEQYNAEAESRKASRREGATDPSPNPAQPVAAEPYRLQPGDLLVIEVLEALPGRPITGQRVVRPDGTISLDFYGDLYVAGLNRKEIKEKLVTHLRKYINDETLGLVEEDPATGKRIPVNPADSDRVFVDESINFLDMARTEAKPARPGPGSVEDRLNDLESRLNVIQQRLGPAPRSR